jgi:signal transduction histidine kinase
MAEPTAFAPAERIDAEGLEEQRKLVADAIGDARCLDAVPGPLVVLNAQRQVTFANQAFLNSIGKKTTAEVLGARPGEAFHCSHAGGPGGCGTSESCSTCGAVTAILESQQGVHASRECRILTDDAGSSLDLHVQASPYDVEGNRYTIFAVEDISHEKRRRALERIFFHDILNAAGGLQGLAELEKDDAGDDEFASMVYSISAQLVTEIRAQRELTAAENNELTIRPVPLRSLALMQEIAGTYAGHEVARGKEIVVHAEALDLGFTTDAVLIKRILGNMVKNALEASRQGETVTLMCDGNDLEIHLSVHNPAVMPNAVRLQVFQRSFSTKSPDRGLGTYSIKLLAERYLGGRVGCQSEEGAGTTFHVVLPMGG